MKQHDDLDLTLDIVFKTLFYRENNYVRKYLLRMLEKVLGYSLEGYTLGPNELGVVTYKQIANKVDIMLISKDKKHIVEVEMNRIAEEKSALSSIKIAENKSLIYLANIIANFYNELEEEYKTPIDVTQVNFNAYYCPYDKEASILCFELYEKVAKISKKGIKEYDLYLPRKRELCYNELKEEEKDYALLMSKTDEERKLLSVGNKEREEVVKLFNNLRKDDEFMATIIDREKYERILFENQMREEIKEVLKEEQKEREKDIRKQCLEQGKKENAFDFIKSMYQNGISINLIAKSAKKSVKEIKSILEIN